VRKPRSDSVRNRGLILAAARHEIAERGPEVGMDEIASRAEVAVGTVYRHFPTKEALVTAIVSESMEQVADDAERCLALCEAGEPARDQLVSFIEILITLSAENQAVLAAMEAMGASKGNDLAVARATTAITRLIEIGHDCSSIPRHVTVADVYMLLATAPYGQPNSVRDRWLDLMLTGLMTESDNPGSHI
jgi:AcrR family transcriptional regulator